MGANFDIMLARDAVKISADVSGPGESVTSVDRGITFNAVVAREQLTAIPQSGSKPLYAVLTTVFIPFDAAEVKGFATVPLKNEVLSFPSSTGAAASHHVIEKVINQDAGGFLVQMR